MKTLTQELGQPDDQHHPREVRYYCFGNDGKLIFKVSTWMLEQLSSTLNAFAYEVKFVTWGFVGSSMMNLASGISSRVPGACNLRNINVILIVLLQIYRKRSESRQSASYRDDEFDIGKVL